MSFETLLDEAVRRGYVAAVRMLRDREAARDACQEAASRALTARASFDQDKEFYPWFYRILKNHCLDLCGRRGRLIYKDEIDAASPDSIEARYIENEEERRVLAAISTLEPDLREIIELRHFQDLSYRELSEILGCPEGTVMSRLYRARKSLRQALIDAERPKAATETRSPVERS